MEITMAKKKKDTSIKIDLKWIAIIILGILALKFYGDSKALEQRINNCICSWDQAINIISNSIKEDM